MFLNFMRAIFRNLWRSKVNALINVASLALGLTVFAFCFLYVKKELSYDRAWPGADRIYRMVVEQKGVPGSPDGTFTNVNTRAYTALLNNYSGYIERIAKAFNGNVKVAGEGSNQYPSIGIVDPVFIEMFRYEERAGSLAEVLRNPSQIAVSETFAATYPGGLSIGSELELEGNYSMNGQRPPSVSFEVAAIFRAPELVSPNLDFSMLVLMDDYVLKLYPQGIRMWADTHQIWLRFKPEVDAADFAALMPDFIDREVTAFNAMLGPGEKISEHLQYWFQPLTALHLNPVSPNEFGAGDKSRVLTTAALGVLVLLVGCSNSISLSLATVLERRREIGIRKAAGALPRDILVHYLSEAVLLALVALLPALALLQLLLPPFLVLLNVREGLELIAADYAVLAAIAMMVGLASGAYPALVLARVKPQLVLKTGAESRGRGTQKVRTLLVGFQFCFALVLMITTLALYAQLQSVRSQPLGFDAENLLYAAITSNSENASSAALLEELRKVPGVTAALRFGTPPNTSALEYLGTSIPFVNKNGDFTEARVMRMSASPGQFALLGIPVLAGREFDATRDAFDAATRQYADGTTAGEGRIVLNRSAVRALGFASPDAAVEQVVHMNFADAAGKVSEIPVRVVGVVEDSMYESLRSKPGPRAFVPMSTGSIYMMRIDPRAVATIIDSVKETWQQVSGVPLQFVTFVEPRVEAAYAQERNESRLLLYSAGLALFLACIGLYGMAAFTMERNIKEIGVRKVLGAGVVGITRLYLWRYARPVLVASLVASPVALYFVLQWMQRFPYQLDRAWLLPLNVAAIGVVLAIALLTVVGLVLKAARSRPVVALRYE
ncbi:MAG: ABC transporter permease [Gammaproteobacteria bacterium]